MRLQHKRSHPAALPSNNHIYKPLKPKNYGRSITYRINLRNCHDCRSLRDPEQENRGWGYYVLAILFPLIGLIVALCLKDLSNNNGQA